jgi:very-short-patch-repair endonuclease
MPRFSHLSQLRPASSEPARQLRKKMTRPEWVLWYYVRARRFEGWKFRRQVPIGRYVVDFLCEGARLIVELDGGQHDLRRRSDAERTAWLESKGYRVLRYWNNDVMENIQGVLETLLDALKRSRSPHPGPLPRERENF